MPQGWTPIAEPTGWTPVEEPGVGARFGEGVYKQTLGPAMQLLKNPVESVKNIIGTALGADELEAIAKQVNSGNYKAGAALIGNYISRNPGDRIAEAAVHPIFEDVQKGDYAGAAGQIAGLGLSVATGKLAPKAAGAVVDTARSAAESPIGALVKKMGVRFGAAQLRKVTDLVETGKDVKDAIDQVMKTEPQGPPDLPAQAPTPPAKVPRTRKGPEPPKIIVASEYRPRPGMPPEAPAEPPSAVKAPTAPAAPEAAAQEAEPPSELQRQLEESNRLIAQGKEARLSPDAKVAIAEKYGVRSAKDKVIAIDNNQGARALKVAGFIDQNYEPAVIDAMGEEHFKAVGDKIGVKDMSADTIKKIKDLISMKRAMQQ